MKIQNVSNFLEKFILFRNQNHNLTKAMKDEYNMIPTSYRQYNDNRKHFVNRIGTKIFVKSLVTFPLQAIITFVRRENGKLFYPLLLSHRYTLD